MKSDTDTPEQKLARSNEGGAKVKRSYTLDEAWDEVQAANRVAGPWGNAPRFFPSQNVFHQEQS